MQITMVFVIEFVLNISLILKYFEASTIIAVSCVFYFGNLVVLLYMFEINYTTTCMS